MLVMVKNEIHKGLRWWNLGKIIFESKIWYHMHAEVPRTLHALEICEMCHT